MTYTGDVQVGGPTQVRVLDLLEIRKAAVGPMQNNAYLLTCRAVGAQLLIDAADDPDRLLALLQEGTTQLDLVVTTHRHRDHHRALASIVAVTGATVAAGADDADAIAEATDIAVTQRLHDGDTVRVGNVALTVVALRGHTRGSVALAYREPGGRAHLFTGDSLFPGGVGATQGPEAFDQLYADVVERVFDRFDDDTWVYPGHGRDTTLGAEREHLTEWRARGW
ncbi:MBL fold metallo-hydrolase [Cellulomonas humilata]|uniref:Glyoxylase-like metal-dependent hydrolase (Beta-lactamase superfamily II) n=1 Tax=Cellulomonas humilata TaxID=144055 RepID=A0ABU0EHC1_9CELL|nr:MBL fold metallo-hydrolase [Cellulomonas humilata]MDQ0374673.1 glyoxylase-like metal-dependent hydrolase (beta-lactamase superfamily II) [Cellulomonas humilata]